MDLLLWTVVVMLSGGFRNFSQGVTQSNKKKNLYIDDNLGIFPKVLHNLIKRKIYILITITKKKKKHANS